MKPSKKPAAKQSLGMAMKPAAKPVKVPTSKGKGTPSMARKGKC